MKKILGFTLIELLIVISIIGILASFISMSFVNPQKQARDAQRKSDIAQYRTALEAFANANNGLYPYFGNPLDAGGHPIGAKEMDDVCTAALTDYAASCPQDPKYSAKIYGYKSNGSGSLGDPTATKYLIYVNGGLEVNTLGSVDGPNGTTWVVCYNGKTGAVNNHWGDVPGVPGIDTFCPVVP